MSAIPGTIQSDHMPKNYYEFKIAGGPNLTAISVSGLERALQNVMLPNNTQASGGRTTPSTLTIQIPAHHEAEVNYMEQWLKGCQYPVNRNHKRSGTVTFVSQSNLKRLQWKLRGVFVTASSTDEQSMSNEGEMNAISYTLSVDRAEKK